MALPSATELTITAQQLAALSKASPEDVVEYIAQLQKMGKDGEAQRILKLYMDQMKMAQTLPLSTKLAARMGWNETGMSHRYKIHIEQEGDAVWIFALIKGQPVVLEDTRALFPCDATVTKLRMAYDQWD